MQLPCKVGIIAYILPTLLMRKVGLRKVSVSLTSHNWQ